LKSARRDYEEKIRRLEIENNELSTLRAQYAVCVKDGEYYKKELSKHTNELTDLRKMKVQLTRELRQEFIRHRQTEQARAREIAVLKRVSRPWICSIDLSVYSRRKCKKITKFEHYVHNRNKKK
jgi:septal ring factor EnvC (AmiA/AmiB activator)